MPLVAGVPNAVPTSTTLPPRPSEAGGAKRPTVAVPRPMTPVVLGARKNRFMEINEMKKTPAYVRRKSPMKVMDASNTKTVLTDKSDEQSKPKQSVPSSGDLFGGQ